jgi:uncharacterized protein YndB with AHSA1/START domain
VASRANDTPPPIRRSVWVSWTPEAAFRRFTAEFGEWWPAYSHSIGGSRVRRIVFECRVGGRIFEEHRDGTRFRWGTVTALESPRRVAFTWHAAYDEQDAQQVEITFVPERAGTRVVLVSSGWEKMGAKARSSHGGYGMTWTAVLARFGRRFSAVTLVFQAMSAAITALGQRQSFIDGSRGRMPAGSGTEEDA